MGTKKEIPVDKINLRMMLVSGKTLEFFFSPTDSASDITQHVYDNWPEALQLPLGKTTVMHLVARERLPEPNNHGHLKKDKRERESCNNCCTIV